MVEQVETTQHEKFTIKRKIFFSLIVLVLFLMALELLSYVGLSFLCLPMPTQMFGETSYMTPDPDLGWAPAPGVSHHVAKYPKGFDIVIRTGNGFRKDGQDICSTEECSIITIGDSHTFGYGLKEDQTLAYQLHTLLSTDQHKCLVFNGGVPGFGPCQYYLRLRSLGRLAPGSLVIIYFNPINDLSGLSRRVDYGSTKPYACLEGRRVTYVRPTLYDAKTHFHFGPDFGSLNQAFTHALPAAPPAATRQFQHSRMWQLLQGLRQKRLRLRGSHVELSEDVGPYRDGGEQERINLEYARRECTQFMASQWPEILNFESERNLAEEILLRIFNDMKRHVENYQAKLLVVVAQEAYGNQGHSLRIREIIAEQFPQYTIQDGQARQVVCRAAQRANIPYLMIHYPPNRMESMFIPYDGHTSADGFSFTARRIVEWIREQPFAFVDGPSQAEALLGEAPDIDTLDGNGYTRLHYAVQNGAHQTVARLISEGADLNSRDRWGETALYIAASRGHNSIIEMLLEKGAAINAADHRGQTPLHQAIQSNHATVVRLLISDGADLNLENNDGKTPLEIAIGRNNPELVESLVANGAEIASIHVAAQLGYLERVEDFLEEGADINGADARGLTPLHHAVQAGHNEVAEFLIAKGADVNGKDKYGYPPLYYALWFENRDIVKLLVINGADVNLTGEKDYPPIYYAVWNDDLDTVKLLVGKGAKFDVKVLDDRTAFHYAVDQGSRDIVGFFVREGIDIPKLYLAACTGDLAGIEKFVEEGADINAQDKLGWTPLYWAASLGRTEVATLLIAHGASVQAQAEDGSAPLHQAAQVGDRELVALMLSKGADVNTKTKQGNTPLHSAASAGHREVAKLLIAKGADVNAKTQNNWTPLHRAAIGGHKDAVEILLAHGADVSVKDSRGRTALDWAKEGEHTEVADLLHTHGAKE